MGRIIFSNFLKLPLGRYKQIIEETEQFIFNQWGGSNLLFIKALSQDSADIEDPEISSRIAARIVKDGKDFAIRYTCTGFNKIYQIDKIFENKNYSDNHPALDGQRRRSMFFRVRHINLRNELTYRIIDGVIKNQKRFLTTGDPDDLVPFYQAQLCIDKSWVSRLVNRISVIIPNGEERLLRSFFQNNKDINKRLIKKIFDKECGDIEAGWLKRPLGDEHVRACLESRYGVKVGRRSIGLYRKGMGIPPAARRGLGCRYPLLSVNFSVLYPLTIDSAHSNAFSGSGIYEIQLNEKEIDYPNSKTKVIYIGSAKNIKKRIKEHLRQKNKNSRIREYIKTQHCLFRYIQIGRAWREEERRLYELFKTTYGAPPRCNKASP